MDLMINEDIFNQLNLTDVSSDVQVELLKAFSSAVFQAVILSCSKNLDDIDRNELLRLLEKGDEEAIGKFLKEKVDNIDAIISEESKRFKETLIEKSKQ